MSKIFQVKPEEYGFPSKIGGLTIKTVTWKDFPAKPPQNTWFLAYTYWNTNWTSTVKNGKGTVLATVAIGPKAWTRAEDDFELLQHEVGHYWIACLCALQFQKRVNFTQKKPELINFGQWCQKVFKKTSSQYAQQQKRYDKQTYHYLNRKQQQEWKQKMIKEFNQYHKFFQEKRKEQEKILLKQENKRVLNKANSTNQRMRSLPVAKKLNNVNNLRPVTKITTIENDVNRPARMFQVRKTNTIINQKDLNKNLSLFEQAKNTILENIEILEGIK